MKRLIIPVVLAIFVMSSSMVMAAKVKCTVDSVEGNTVTLSCKKADKLKAGQVVEVKEKKKKAYEGC